MTHTAPNSASIASPAQQHRHCYSWVQGCTQQQQLAQFQTLHSCNVVEPSVQHGSHCAHARCSETDLSSRALVPRAHKDMAAPYNSTTLVATANSVTVAIVVKLQPWAFYAQQGCGLPIYFTARSSVPHRRRPGRHSTGPRSRGTHQ